MPEPLGTRRGRTSRWCGKWLGMLLLVLVPSGAAFAYWTVTGIGAASANSGTISTPSVVALAGGDAPSSALLPGGTSDVILRIVNPNSYALTLTSISVNGSIAVTGATGTCTSSGVTTNFPSSPTIAVPVGSSLVHLPGAALMSLGSQSGCQGATFSIPVSVSFQK
jgi:hypothetical protein